MVGPTRFELVTSAMSRQRSNQLSYGPLEMGAIGADLSWDILEAAPDASLSGRFAHAILKNC